MWSEMRVTLPSLHYDSLAAPYITLHLFKLKRYIGTYTWNIYQYAFHVSLQTTVPTVVKIFDLTI